MFYIVISLAYGAVPLFSFIPKMVRGSLKCIQSIAKDGKSIIKAAADNGGNPLQNGVYALEFNSKEAADKVKTTVLDFFNSYLPETSKPADSVELLKDLDDSKLFELPTAKAPKDPKAGAGSSSNPDNGTGSSGK